MDLRDEWKNPNLPVSIPVSGFFGYDAATRSPGMAHVTAAQFAVGDPATHPELHGHVASMETRGFWREPQCYHYWWNAETHALIGQAMATGMLKGLQEA